MKGSKKRKRSWWWNFQLPKLPGETTGQNVLRTIDYIVENSPKPSMPPSEPITTKSQKPIKDSDEIPWD